MMPPIRSDQNDSFDDRTSSHLDNNTGKSMIDSANLLRSHVQSAHSSAQYLSQLSANSSASLTPKLDHNGLPLSQQQKQQTQQQQYSNQQTPLTKAELRKVIVLLHLYSFSQFQVKLMSFQFMRNTIRLENIFDSKGSKKRF